MIHTLYYQGFSIRQISKILNLNRRTVSKRLKEKDLKPYIKRSHPSKLESYKDYVEKRIQQAYPDRIPSTVILREIKDIGYTGSLRTLQKYTKTIYENISSKKEEKNNAVIRFETEKGYQAQVDWITIISGKKPIYAFVWSWATQEQLLFTLQIICNRKHFSPAT